MLTIFQQIILGVIQGVSEWLPLSSSGMLTLVLANIFQITNFGEILKQTLFLHLGTFFAALIYFRKDVKQIFGTLFKFKFASLENKKIFLFLLISTIITGIIGLIILKLLTNLTSTFIPGRTITLFVALLLIITGIAQLSTKKVFQRKESNLKFSDSILLGFVQGLATLPGLSRSGITVSTLLVRKFDDTTALRLSFLMSLPVVLIANIALNINEFVLTSTAFYGLLASFVFGLLTISLLMKVSKKINLGYFVIIFAVLMMLSLLI